MDTITHGIAGALVGKAFFAQPQGLRPLQEKEGRVLGGVETPPCHSSANRVAIWAATLGALAPDSDSLFELFDSNDLAIIELHRGFTHSFLFLLLFALGLAGVTRWVAGKRNWACPSFPRLTLIYAVGLAVHILLDLITSFGTMIWSPLVNTRVAWDLTFIIDFTFTGIVLLPQVAAWAYRRAKGSFSRRLLGWTFFSVSAVGVERLARAVGTPISPWAVVAASLVFAAVFFLPARDGWGFRVPRAAWCRAGCAVLVVYMGLCFVAHRVALARVGEFVRSQGIRVEHLGALPLPASLVRWSGLVRTPEGVYQASFNVLQQTPPEFRFFADSAPNRYTEMARELPAVKRYLWFARFPWMRYREENGQNVVDFTDLRFARGRQRQYPFTFRVTLGASGEVIHSGWVD